MAHPPKSFQGILWSADVDKLDLEKDKWYIIHQFLVYATLEEMKWLFDTYGFAEIRSVFLQQPGQVYTHMMYYFVKDHILNLKEDNPDEAKYVTSIYGPVRQRASGSF